MRQAGRCLPAYRELRKRHNFVEMCHTPELACQVTLLPIDRLGVDAAILFSDIMMVPEAMGMSVDYAPDPILSHPIASERDVQKLRRPEMEEACDFVTGAVGLVRRELQGKVPLIGFAGSPFTVAAYMVEGRGTKMFAKMKQLVFSRPELAEALLERVADATADYLNAQIQAGVQVIQLFESWAGVLDSERFERFVLKYARRVVDGIRRRQRADEAPVYVIYFAHGAPWALPVVRDSGADVIGIDWRLPFERAIEMVGADTVVQGNLDPAALFASDEVLANEARTILRAGVRARGHVFNLGHGVWPDTDPGKLRHLVDLVHDFEPGERG